MSGTYYWLITVLVHLGHKLALPLLSTRSLNYIRMFLISLEKELCYTSAFISNI